MAFLVAAVCILGSISAQAAPVQVEIFSGYTVDGSGAPYSGLVGSFTSSDIRFGTDTGWAWHPLGRSLFGADVTGTLHVAAPGTYTLSLGPDDGKWHHIAATYDGATFAIYVDGKLEASEVSTGNMAVSTYNVCIGDNSGATGRYWNGLIDDVRIYKQALTAAEIKVLLPPQLKAISPSPANGRPPA